LAGLRALSLSLVVNTPVVFQDVIDICTRHVLQLEHQADVARAQAEGRMNLQPPARDHVLVMVEEDEDEDVAMSSNQRVFEADESDGDQA
jgi:hypothetical protein